MVGSASGPGSTFKAFLGSTRVRVPLSNKIRVRVGSVQHIYGSLRVRVRIFGPVKTSSVNHSLKLSSLRIDVNFIMLNHVKIWQYKLTFVFQHILYTRLTAIV